MSLHEYEVGKPYLPGRTRWPEITQFRLAAGQYSLTLFMASPTAAEKRDLKSGLSQFVLFTEGDLLILLFRFGLQPWSDAPFSWHMEPEAERLPPPALTTPESRILLPVTLVDAATGLIAVLRAVTWSPDFSRTVEAAIRDQIARPWPGQASYDRQLADLYRRFPDSSLLLDHVISG